MFNVHKNDERTYKVSPVVRTGWRKVDDTEKIFSTLFFEALLVMFEREILLFFDDPIQKGVHCRRSLSLMVHVFSTIEQHRSMVCWSLQPQVP